MGKDLHYSIKPFIENALRNHGNVSSIEPIELDEYYAYRIKRNRGMSDVIVVLSDEYSFNYYSYLNKPEILKNGGVILIAKPEATCFERNEKEDKIVVCKLKWLMGALHREEFWTYEPPKEDKK